jgi:hypothetical protein
LQDGKKDAKGPTALEFAQVVMNPVKYAADDAFDTLEQDTPDVLKGKGTTLQYSFDNAKIHLSAIKDGLLQQYVEGFTEEVDRFPLTPYSPDLHKVIEHTHANAVVEFQKWLHKNPGKSTVAEYKEAFKACYHSANSQQSVLRDVNSLPKLYEWVHKNGGKYPPASMR